MNKKLLKNISLKKTLLSIPIVTVFLLINMKKISVLIPVYNNQETINSIYLRIKRLYLKSNKIMKLYLLMMVAKTKVIKNKKYLFD